MVDIRHFFVSGFYLQARILAPPLGIYDAELKQLQASNLEKKILGTHSKEPLKLRVARRTFLEDIK